MMEPRGARHPLTTMQEQIADVFVAMGWEVAEGPEVEHEWLQLRRAQLRRRPPGPQMQDTSSSSPPDAGLVMRTHTSPVQARSMLEREPADLRPLPRPRLPHRRVRRDPPPVFHQVEGLAVDKGITMAHLKGTLDHFARGMFGEAQDALPPVYFPFTEPSRRARPVCFVCRGVEPDVHPCRTCRGEGWIEWGGCGMVNPRVLRACGIDPEEYSGFAFGMGIERTLMFRHGVAGHARHGRGRRALQRAFGMEV